MGLKLAGTITPAPTPAPVAASKGKKGKDAKEEKPKVATGLSSLDTLLAAIQKSKGNHIAVAATQIRPVMRLATGHFEFDFYTGGGFPRGRYTIIYGPESSGKTNIALKAIAAAQRLPGPCNKAVFVNIEQTFDPAWAAKMGVDVDKLIVINPGYGEEAVDLVDALVRAKDVAILVADSLAALVPSKEIGQTTEIADVGSSSLLIKRMVNKLMYAFSECARNNHFPAVVLINQRRFKIGVIKGDPEVMPGGEAQKFLASLIIRIYGKNEILKEVNPDLPAFKATHAVIKKAKVPVRAVEFDYKQCMYEHDGLKIGESRSWNTVCQHLKELGYLEKVSKGWELEGMLFPVLTAIQAIYEKDHEFMLRLQGLVIDAYKDQAILVAEKEAGASMPVQPGEAVPVQYHPQTDLENSEGPKAMNGDLND